MSIFTKHIGVDLGTVNVLVWVKGKGIVLQEPSVVAIALNDEKIVAVGEEARAMLGRTPDTIEVARPLRDGVIADYLVTERMLRYFIEKVTGRIRLFKPLIAISVPVGVTSVESRAVHDAAIQAGGREAYLIPEPLAAALGAGMPVGTPTGNLVVDIGGGTSEAAVVSMNGIVEFASVRVGGNRIDEAIMSLCQAQVQPADRRADGRRGQDQDRQRPAPGRRGTHGGPGPGPGVRPAQDDHHHLGRGDRSDGRAAGCHRRGGQGRCWKRRRPSWRPTSSTGAS